MVTGIVEDVAFVVTVASARLVAMAGSRPAQCAALQCVCSVLSNAVQLLSLRMGTVRVCVLESPCMCTLNVPILSLRHTYTCVAPPSRLSDIQCCMLAS